MFYEKSGVGQLPRMYGVIAFSVIGSAFTLLGLGFNVAAARTKAIEMAKKEGDEKAEERFSYPVLYAEGLTPITKQFNCVQRSHQHAFESYTQMVAMTILGGIRFPLASGATLLMWCFCRGKWAEGYANEEGDASKRYDHWASFGIWYSLIMQMGTAAAAGIALLSDK